MTRRLLNGKKTAYLESRWQKALSLLKESLKLLSYLPQLPTTHDLQKYLKVGDHHSPAVVNNLPNGTACEGGFPTTDVKELNLCCNQQEPKSLLNGLITQTCDKGISKDVVNKCLEEVLKISSGYSNLIDALEICETANDPSLSFHIVGDNVDLDIKVRHMNDENRNKSLHYFNLVAFKDQVSGKSLPDVHDHTLADIPVSTFLPTYADLKNLKRDFVVLWSRVIVKYMMQFSFFKSSVIYHIPHLYSDVMKNPVEEVRF